MTSSDPYHEPALDNSANGTVAYYRTYKYDKLGNMLDLYHNAGAGNTFHRYFNDWNNVGSAAFELSNLATEINYGGTTVNYTFDDNGNMLTEGGSRSFTWDYGDRMRGFSEGTSVQAVYLYDGGGNRVKKIVVDGSGNSVVTVYIDGGFEHLYKLSSAAVVSEAHNELHVMDGRSRIAVKRIGSAFSGDASPAVRYNLEDHLGNSSVSVDSSGSLITREEYFPFGETSFGSYARKRYRFCGKERDEESGLYYYGARYYACWSCRFVSIDPLAGEMPWDTPFCYATNNPVVFVDIDGLAPGGGGDQVATDDGMGSQPESASSGNTYKRVPYHDAMVDQGWSLTGSALDAEGNVYATIDLQKFIGKSFELVGNQYGDLVGIRPIEGTSIHPTIEQGIWDALETFGEGLAWMAAGPPGLIYKEIQAGLSIVNEGDYSQAKGLLLQHLTTLSGPIAGINKGVEGVDTMVNGDAYDRSKFLTMEGATFLLNALTVGAVKGAKPTPKMGVYDVVTTEGAYVGESGNLLQRIWNHFSGSSRSALKGRTKVSQEFFEMDKSTRLERQVYEQYRIEIKGGVKNPSLHNIRNPMGGRMSKYHNMIEGVINKYNLPRI